MAQLAQLSPCLLNSTSYPAVLLPQLLPCLLSFLLMLPQLPPKRPIPTVLVAWQCYLNSVLQNIVASPGLREHLLCKRDARPLYQARLGEGGNGSTGDGGDTGGGGGIGGDGITVGAREGCGSGGGESRGDLSMALDRFVRRLHYGGAASEPIRPVELLQVLLLRHYCWYSSGRASADAASAMVSVELLQTLLLL